MIPLQPVSPRVSVVLAAMNDEPFIAETLRSIAAQAYPALEIHVQVHAASKDRTAEIARSLGAQVAVEPDAGVPDAFNKGLAQTTGEILIFLGGDDPLLPGAIQSLVEALVQQPDAAFAYGDISYIDSTGRPYTTLRGRPFDIDAMFWGNFVPTQAVAIRRNALHAVGGYRTGIINADWDLWIRLGSRFSSVYVPRLLARYRVHDGSLTVNNPAKMAASMRFVAETLLSDPVIISKLKSGTRRARAGAYFLATPMSVLAGDR